jgi:hypothetical protein
VFQAFAVSKTTGKLTYVNAVGPNRYTFPALTFTGNNEFAYEGGFPFLAYQRSSSAGALTPLSINPALPSGGPDGNAGGYEALNMAAADPTGHVAIPAQYYENSNPSGSPRIAVYTSSSTGNLTTASTYTNMPATSVGTLLSVSMSPSGELWRADLPFQRPESGDKIYRNTDHRSSRCDLLG